MADFVGPIIHYLSETVMEKESFITVYCSVRVDKVSNAFRGKYVIAEGR